MYLFSLQKALTRNNMGQRLRCAFVDRRRIDLALDLSAPDELGRDRFPSASKAKFLLPSNQAMATNSKESPRRTCKSKGFSLGCARTSRSN